MIISTPSTAFALIEAAQRRLEQMEAVCGVLQGQISRERDVLLRLKTVLKAAEVSAATRATGREVIR
jgi:hypothetical protein